MIKKIKISELNKSIYQSQKIFNQLPSLYKEINQIINILYKTIQNNNKIYICGNGGSASDAEHFSTEFLVRLRPKLNRKSFPIINLGMNLSYLTACGNDYSFEDIFLRSFSSMVDKNDILWVISTSGNSKNILKVLKYAKFKKIKSIAFLGKKGGKAKKFADINLIIPSQNTARIQEMQKFLGHFILEETENLLVKKK